MLLCMFFFTHFWKEKLSESYSFSFLMYLALGVKNSILLFAQNSEKDVGKSPAADRWLCPGLREHRSCTDLCSKGHGDDHFKNILLFSNAFLASSVQYHCQVAAQRDQ